MGRNMGFDFGLESPTTCLKRKYRWLFIIDGVSADTQSANALPPLKSSRPTISFKETEIQHLSETIWFPVKPEWKPVNLTLYDLQKSENPIFEWIRDAYDPSPDSSQFLANFYPAADGFKKPFARLEMYDGCGNVMERWTFENVWPQQAEFGELDMANSEYVTVDLLLRYDRAYIS